MDKYVIFAVAGSGKTQYIINSLTVSSKALLITYTENGYENLFSRVIEKFGFVPDGVRIYTYFGFLYNFCFKPLLAYQYPKIKGINFEYSPKRSILESNDLHYITDNLLISNRVAKLLMRKCSEEIVERINLFFEEVYVDEVQDFSSHDFDILGILAKLEGKVILLGDFYQHTFDTSRDGNKRKNLHDDIDNYQREFEKYNYQLDVDTLSKSHRCPVAVCNFVQSRLGIHIESMHQCQGFKFETISDKHCIKRILEDNQIIKLFYQNSHKYNLNAQNWGGSKG